MMIPLIVLCVAVVMMAIEASRPGRSWPRVADWWWRVALLNAAQAGVVWLAGRTWHRWLMKRQPWSAEWMGEVLGAWFGYFVITFVYYWWHRWRHEVPFLWRWIHQLHHSPQRLEVLASFYKHPFELLANGLISSVILFLIGLGPEAAAGTVLISGIAELFYHWNVKTPYWLGFVVQRPESHCVHHQEGIHSFNYSDLPLWDMLFGTFRNPRVWRANCGFGEAEHRLLAMLCGIDVTKPEATGVKL
jgi:sterol desaturase/sphingolipid hydroxylase (fatty acid hydroxylase superfamily)